MDKDQVAAVLEEIGTLLEIQGENPFRCQAYHNAARALRHLELDLGQLVREAKLQDVPGIGKTLQDKITTLVNTGALPFYEELKRKTPPGLGEMLQLPGVGPKKIRSIHDQLGVNSLDVLKEA